MSETLMTGNVQPSDAAASQSAEPAAASAAPVDAGNPAAADPAAAAAAEAAKVDAPAETAEEKAAREAAETPEVKAEREAKELAAAGAPEAYTEFTMPDGVQLDTELAGEFQGIAKELNLPQAAAQKVADLGAKMVLKMAQAVEAQNAADVAGWTTAAKADAEIGGDKLPANLALANKAVDAFGSPAFKELLTASGLGNHPEMIRLFAKVGGAISEDTLVTGGGGAQPAKDAASKLYPEQGKK